MEIAGLGKGSPPVNPTPGIMRTTRSHPVVALLLIPLLTGLGMHRASGGDPGKAEADAAKSPIVVPEEVGAWWHFFNVETNYVYQNQNYEITGFETDYQPPVIEVPEIRITNADVNHLVPAGLPPFIRDPLLAQARAAAQREAEAIAEEEVRLARAMIPTFDENTVRSIENTAHTETVRVGFSPLPFVTLFGVGGRVDGEVDVSLADPFGDLTVGYGGWIYGGGATVAVGTDLLFASLTGVYTVADLEDGDSSIDTWVLTPKVGLHGDRGAIWVGGQHQATSHTQSGSISVDPLGPVNFAVSLQDETAWNWLVGGRLNLGERCYLILEGGFGDRTQGLVALGMDF